MTAMLSVQSNQGDDVMDEEVCTSAVIYREPKAALEWLTRAFGFEVTMAIDGPPDAPEMCHYEMAAVGGKGRLMIGAEWSETARSPASVGGANTQNVHVMLPGGLDEHCAAAREAGARVVMEPEDQFYGDRVYRVLDLEGHAWTFSAKVRDVTLAEAEAALGQPIMATNWE
jgi:uncharacterized glyoxalase superfamily protein PhnB